MIYSGRHQDCDLQKRLSISYLLSGLADPHFAVSNVRNATEQSFNLSLSPSSTKIKPKKNQSNVRKTTVVNNPHHYLASENIDAIPEESCLNKHRRYSVIILRQTFGSLEVDAATIVLSSSLLLLFFICTTIRNSNLLAY